MSPHENHFYEIQQSKTTKTYTLLPMHGNVYTGQFRPQICCSWIKKRKRESLISTYTLYTKKIKDSIRSGTSSDEVFKSTWFRPVYVRKSILKIRPLFVLRFLLVALVFCSSGTRTLCCSWAMQFITPSGMYKFLEVLLLFKKLCVGLHK